ncbi:MAG TPA: HAMP domain-containing sensor histidine kinase [Acidimicrobiales bacterium]|nr:HAMP domain-containing sensor histidine kinase [Acidimicrobiales bacterium]
MTRTARSSSRREPAGSARTVRRHARDVAISATLVALAVYLASAAIADLAVFRHLQDSVDERLATRLSVAARTVGNDGVPAPAPTTGTALGAAAASRGGGGDLDDAPIFLWWIPERSRTATLLDGPGPSLPASSTRTGRPASATIAGRHFTVAGVALARGRLVAATSIEQVLDVRTTLLVIEGSLLPVMLLTFFLVATVIGRRAATPIERARQQQLDFTADASHELRTPLSVIEAEVGLALSTERAAPAYRDSLERISEESGRLRGIVDDLIWLARLDAIPSAPPDTRVDLGPLVEQCASRFTPVAALRGVELRVSVDPTPAVVAAPAEWLDRLVSVLVDNACRYTSAGGLVEVAVLVVDGRPTLTVSDTGPGIAPEDRDEIFQRFRRVSTVPGGAGLGLAIADTIVRATSGRWHLGAARTGGADVQVSWSSGGT